MKYQITTILLLFLIFSNNCIAQDSLASQLLKLEEQWFDAHNDTVKNDCALEKFNLYLFHEQHSKIALSEAQRVDYTLIENRDKRKYFLWNASIVAYMNNDLDYANYYFVRFSELGNDTSINKQFLQFLINEQYNHKWDSALAQLSQKDSLFGELICLKKLTVEEDKKNRYMLASALVPGLGSAMLGYPVKGAVSFSINAMIGVLVVNLLRQHLWFNTVLFGGALIKKFYAGNIRLSSALYKKKRAQFKEMEASSCAKNLEILLKKYPLTFKYYQPIPKL